MESNLQTKPSWLSFYETDYKNTLNTDFGFDSTGMWFSGNAGGCGDVSFPIRTNFDIPSEQPTTVIFTINRGSCTDQGMCFFQTGVEPSWSFSSCDNRIEINMNCNNVELNGQYAEVSGPNLGEGAAPYTFEVTYTPSESTVDVKVYDGTSINDTLIGEYTLNERLPDGPYRIGFDADADGPSDYGYFTFLSINAEEMVNYPLPKLMYQVKTYDPVQLVSTLPPDGNIENIIKALKEKTVWLPYIDYAVKHGDIITLYGKQAIDFRNKLSQINAGGTIVEAYTEPSEDVWSFSTSTMSWPGHDGYSIYDGSWSSYDDGQTDGTIKINLFKYYGETVKNIFLSTNGEMYLRSNTIYGNPGDLYLTPGNLLDNGDTQNWYYKNITIGTRTATKMTIICGACCDSAETENWSYAVNLYRDSKYQYIEIMCQDNLADDSGTEDDRRNSSNDSQVWKSDLTGNTWTYLGVGSVV